MKPPSVRIVPPGSLGTTFQEVATSKTADMAQETFEELLFNIATTQESHSQNTAPPLSTEALQYLIRMIEEQMTAGLFRAVVGEEAGTHNGSMEQGWGGQNWGNLPLPVTPFLTPPKKSSHPYPVEPSPVEKQPKETNPPATVTIDQIISKASEAYEVDPALIKAVIRAESAFDPQATSSKGAVGLMQLMPETAKDLGVEEPYDPLENVLGGTRYLKTLLDRYEGNIPLALAGYNWGMGNVERHPGKLPEETRTYIGRVNDFYREMTS